MIVEKETCTKWPTYLHCCLCGMQETWYKLVKLWISVDSSKLIITAMAERTSFTINMTHLYQTVQTVHRIQSNHQRYSTTKLNKQRSNQSSSKKKPLRETSYIPKSVNATNQGVSRTHNPWILFMLETLERFIQKLMRQSNWAKPPIFMEGCEVGRIMRVGSK